jgi:hypothetical protein
MGADPPASPEAVKSKALVLINEVDRSVATIYTSYVRPFCQFTGTFPSVLLTEEELWSQPPTIIKVRMFLYQLMVQLDAFAQSEFDDPITADAYRVVSALVCMVSPLAVAMSRDVYPSFFQELRTVHNQRWPLTIAKLEDDVGFSAREPDLVIPPFPDKRTHYKDASPAQLTAPPRHTFNGDGLFHSRAPELGRTVKIHITKTRHGPDGSNVKPPLQKKPS